MIHLGAPAAKDDLAARTIESGRSVMIFLMLDLGKANAPGTVAHTLHVLGDKDDAHDIVLAPLPVVSESPIVVAPPLRGTWIAGDSVNNLPDAAHRRAVIVADGHAWLAQRYAIDWVQIQTVDGTATTGGQERKLFLLQSADLQHRGRQSRRYVGRHARECAAFSRLCRAA
jgi:hypothetical protein